MLFKRAIATLRVITSGFSLMGMSWRSSRLLAQLFPGKTRRVLELMGHPVIDVMVLALFAYLLGNDLLKQHYSGMLYTGYLVVGYLVLRKCVLFANNPQDLEPTSSAEQLAWVQQQDAMVQRRYARCEQPLHKDTWKELQRLADGLEDVARTRAVKRASQLDAVLPTAPETHTPRRRF